MRQARINMSCGQTDIYPKALEEMGKQLGTPIYYPPYWEIEVAAVEMIQRLLHTKDDVILMDGCATYGEEAAMVSTLEEGDTVITAISGIFGQVLYDIASVIGAEPVPVRVEDGDVVTLEMIREALEEHPEAKMVAVVHVETSMGTVNPVDEIGDVVRKFPGVLYMVDAVSSFACMEVRVDDWGIDLCCTSPQKSLNAPQGTAIVAVSERAWRRMEERRTPIRSLCMDLTVWRAYHQGVRRAYAVARGEGGVQDVAVAAARKAAHGPSPSYVLIKGLKAALDEVFDEGPERVFWRHKVASKAVREAVRALGLGVKAKREEIAAPSCTKVVWPKGLDVGKLGKLMQEKYGVAIGGDRIGTMGFVARPQYVLPTIYALEQTLKEMGVNVPAGAGVAAATRVFAEEGAL
ncbi:MAG TPA: alanine--glyoxylate aminotransferase family protein [Candidatus Latescibacteria bacterium]|nr:alanine--glyoxylate aminotransferase family protein [Candidatus Latescibacterota bacterium]